jgi:hypothetical protein
LKINGLMSKEPNGFGAGGFWVQGVKFLVFRFLVCGLGWRCRPFDSFDVTKVWQQLLVGKNILTVLSLIIRRY